MQKTYKYDAFISYRHLAPDKPIAERLQKLLETYSPPKDVLKSGEKIKLHLFRDETELPTSNDLGNDIRDALEHSRYLVVICSPEYEKSKWCMEEVSYFKKLHGGSNRNIIIVLADDPDRRPTFPDILRLETVTETLESGETVTTQEEIEPLAANVSAKTQAQMLKRLKNEFLRVAAPLIGCGFDDLYKREQRRRTRRILTVSLSTAAVFAVATLLSISALLTISSQKKEIEANAAALLSSNQELLIRESEMLEKDGDLYGALDSAAQAIPDEGTAHNGAIGQCVSLLDVYKPDSFAPYKKIHFSATPDDILLLDKGKTLAVKTNNNVSLWNTESGEKISENTGVFDTAFYRNPRIEKASMSEIEKGWLRMVSKGAFDLNTVYRKDVFEETSVGGENALFEINGDDERTISRISPTDGSPLWTMQIDYASFLSDSLSSADVLVVETLGSLLLLDSVTGAEIAEYDLDSLRAQLDLLRFSIYPIGEYLIFTGERDSSVQCVVCRAAQQQPEVLFRTTFFNMDDVNGVSFDISGETLCVSGYSYTNMVLDEATAFFRGYDLKNGACLWSAEAETALSNDSTAGFIDPDKGAFNDYPVAFAVVGDRLFAANAETCAVVVNQALPGESDQVYYSQNGFLFITNKDGIEYELPLRRMGSDEKTVRYYLNHDFHTGFKESAYCNNVYAVFKPDETDVILYRVIPNDARKTLYRLDDEGSNNITTVNLSPDKTFAVIAQENPQRQLVILETASGKVRKTIPFETRIKSVFLFGSGRLAVITDDSLQIVNMSDGKAERAFSDEDYDVGSAILTSERLIIQEKKGKIWNVEPEQKPAAVTLPESITVTKLCSMSPSGRYLLLETSENGTSENRLRIMDLESGASVVCEALAVLQQYGLHSSFAWNPDETAVYLLWEGTVAGFSCTDGTKLCEAEALPGTEKLQFVGDSLCLLDQNGQLTRVEIHETELKPLQQINMSAYVQGNGFVFQRGQNGLDYLLSRESGSAFCHCAVIDTESFEIVYGIEWCCGIDDDRGVAYLKYYDCFDAYSIPNAAQLKALANARLGG